MADGEIPLGKNDQVRVSGSDPSAGFLENKLESTDDSVGIAANSCNDKVDLTVKGLGGFDFKWIKTTVDFSDFNTAAFTVNFTPVEYTGLAAGSTPLYIKVKHSTAFGGGGVGSAKVKAFFSGTGSGPSISVFSVIGDKVGGTGVISDGNDIMDHAAVSDLEIELTVTGATADNLTAGVADIWILFATLT